MKEFRIRPTPRPFFWALTMVVIACGTAGAFATPAIQTPVDFSGDWVLDEAYVKKGGPRQPLCGHACEIAQDKKTLTLKAGNTTVTYRLDGVPVKSVDRFGEYAAERTVTARWEGPRLVIATKVGKTPESKLALSLEHGKLAIWSNRRGFEMSGVESKVTYTRRVPRLDGERD